MDQKQVLERWLRQLKKNEISPDAVGLGPDKEQALRYIREELEKIEAMEKKQEFQQTNNKFIRIGALRQGPSLLLFVQVKHLRLSR
jgi:hypothetical protein